MVPPRPPSPAPAGGPSLPGPPRGVPGNPGERLRCAVERGRALLATLPAAQTDRPVAPGKWSPRELVGHLIDSASNNHQRFVRAGLGADLVFPPYDQDAWVRVQAYAGAPWAELVDLWRLFNLHLARVMDATPPATRDRPCVRHNLDQIAFHTTPADEPVSLGGFMEDYVVHLEHHLDWLQRWTAGEAS